jgi:hypothetical protein
MMTAPQAYGARYLGEPRRTLPQYLAELERRLAALPLDDPGRGELARRIRQVEAAIDNGVE